jgi:glycosyltransferase involved in cell wall biosynthesis
MRFHIIVNPLVPTYNDGYNCDAFNTFAKSFAKMICKTGKVFFYGTAGNPFKDEDKYKDITFYEIMTDEDYKGLQPNSHLYLTHRDSNQVKQSKSLLWEKYGRKTTELVLKTSKKGDFVVYCYSVNQSLRSNKNLIHVIGMEMGGKFEDCEYRIICTGTYADELKKQDKKNNTQSWAVVPPIIENPKICLEKDENKQKIFLYMGRLFENKGIVFFFHLAKMYSQYEFIVAGAFLEGDEEENWKVKERTHLKVSLNDGTKEQLLEIPENMKVVGYADTNKRKELYLKCTALIQPSFYEEPFGYNVIEAYLHGRPVITTDRGSFKETVKHGTTGFICKYHQDFFIAIQNIQNIQREACLEEGKKYIEENLEQRYIQIYKDFQEHSGLYESEKSENNGSVE